MTIVGLANHIPISMMHVVLDCRTSTHAILRILHKVSDAVCAQSSRVSHIEHVVLAWHFGHTRFTKLCFLGKTTHSIQHVSHHWLDFLVSKVFQRLGKVDEPFHLTSLRDSSEFFFGGVIQVRIYEQVNRNVSFQFTSSLVNPRRLAEQFVVVPWLADSVPLKFALTRFQDDCRAV